MRPRQFYRAASSYTPIVSRRSCCAACAASTTLAQAQSDSPAKNDTGKPKTPTQGLLETEET